MRRAAETGILDVKTKKDRKPQCRLVGRHKNGCEFAPCFHYFAELPLRFAHQRQRMLARLFGDGEPDIAVGAQPRRDDAAERRKLTVDEPGFWFERVGKPQRQFAMQINPQRRHRRAMLGAGLAGDDAAVPRLSGDDFEVRH